MHQHCCDHHSDTTASAVCLPTGSSLLLLPPRLVAATLCSALEVVKKTFDGSYGDCPECCGKHRHKSDCMVPETACPADCVGVVYWRGCGGDTLTHRLQVFNQGLHEREFTLTASKFTCTDQTVSIAPDKQTLAPQESFTANISFAVPDDFGGGLYHADIRLKGAFEQFIRIHLCVLPHQACCSQIEQGEIPTRIKAHHWFHHFQCEEACFTHLSKPLLNKVPS